MKQIKIYTTVYCPYCKRAKMLLDAKGIDYNEIAVDDDAEKRQEMMQLSGRRTVPQIFIDDKPIGGCDDLYELDRSGKLDELIN